MGKHDQAQQQKNQRNLKYALKYRQKVCKTCKHRTSKRVKHCPICHGEKWKWRRTGADT